jgi:hypothetical protein
VYDLHSVQEVQGVQHLNCEDPDAGLTQTFELVGAEQLVQVGIKYLKCDTLKSLTYNLQYAIGTE